MNDNRFSNTADKYIFILVASSLGQFILHIMGFRDDVYPLSKSHHGFIRVERKND